MSEMNRMNRMGPRMLAWMTPASTDFHSEVVPLITYLLTPLDVAFTMIIFKDGLFHIGTYM